MDTYLVIKIYEDGCRVVTEMNIIYQGSLKNIFDFMKSKYNFSNSRIRNFLITGNHELNSVTNFVLEKFDPTKNFLSLSFFPGGPLNIKYYDNVEDYSIDVDSILDKEIEDYSGVEILYDILNQKELKNYSGEEFR